MLFVSMQCVPVKKYLFNTSCRFYTALALQDLINEVPLSDVATKFQCARGFLQGLQQAAATFAGRLGTSKFYLFR